MGFSKDGMKVSAMCVAPFVHCLPYSWIPKEHPPMLLHPKSAHYKQQQQPTNKQQPTPTNKQQQFQRSQTTVFLIAFRFP